MPPYKQVSINVEPSISFITAIILLNKTFIKVFTILSDKRNSNR